MTYKVERGAFEARPPAKVNLTLEVVGRRPDGYHDLHSIFLRIGLCDRLTVRLAPPHATADALTVVGLPGAPVVDNLVLRAFDALRAHRGGALPPLEAVLEKRIPAAAGLGGGSSDAASALKLAQACWGVGLSDAEESAIAAALGSDVPFFVEPPWWPDDDDETTHEGDIPAGLVSGRGEHVSGLPFSQWSTGFLLVTPFLELPTAHVFARFDELAGQPDRAPESVETILPSSIVLPPPGLDMRLVVGLDQPPTEVLFDAFLDQPTADDLITWVATTAEPNDLWRAAASLEPSLVRLRDSLERASGRRWLLSGSGPTLFTIYASAQEAAEAGGALAQSRMSELESTLINAVDLVGPDPIWRFP